MAKENVVNILNLVSELNSSLAAYFEKSKFHVVLRHEVSDFEEIDYIVVSTSEEAKEITSEYNTVKNEIKIICLEPSSKVRDFLLSNGRLMLNEHFGDDFLSTHIIDKFFNQQFNIHLDDTFQTNLKDIKEFKITNHLATGFAIDQLSVDAFDAGFNIVPIRSFVDHVVYYFTYLKQAGLAGIPFEFEYGFNDGIFVINIHAPVKNFVAEYMIDSFGEVNSKDPLSYLLGVTASSCEFLDLTYIEDPGKIVLTGFFSKDGAKGLRGLSFNNILTTSQVSKQVEQKVKNFISQETKVEELNKRQDSLKDKALPGGILEMVSPPSEDSIFHSDTVSPDELILFMVDNFYVAVPDGDITNFSKENFENFQGLFNDQKLIGQLSEEDIDYLVERVQKHQLAKAYNDEISKVRESTREDENLVKDLQETLTDEVANRVSSHVDATLLNSILAKEDIPELKTVNDPIFGEFKQSIPEFSVEDVFSEIIPQFADVDNFDASSAFDSFAEDAPMSGPDFSPENLNLEDGFGVQEDPGPGFEEDSFSDLLPENPEEFHIPGLGDEDPFSSLVNGGDQEEEQVTNVSGLTDDDEWSTTVSGGKEEADDFMQKISGMSDDDDKDFAMKFSNSFAVEDENYSFKFSSAEEMKKEMNFHVKNSLAHTPGLDGMDLKVKSFVQKEAPGKINAGFDTYAKSLGKTLESLSEDDINNFRQTALPEIMESLLNDDALIKGFSSELEEFSTTISGTSEFDQKFKDNLEAKLSNMNGVEKEDNRFVVSENNMSEEDMQNLVKDTIKETFDDVFKLSNASPEEIDAKEKMIIKSLSKTLNMDEKDVALMVKGASQLAREKEKRFVAEKLYDDKKDEDPTLMGENGLDSNGADYNQVTNSKVEATLIEKLKDIESENKQLKTNLSVMTLKLNSTEKVKDKFDKAINDSHATKDELSKIVSNSTMAKPGLNAVEKKQLIESIEEGNPLSVEDTKKLVNSLEKENEIIELAKAAEKKLKILQLESEKKDALFKSEIEKVQKAMSGKEIVLAKAKDAMKNAINKKEQELGGYKKQVNELNKKLNNDQSSQLKTQVNALTKDKEILEKSTELYKGKLEQMIKNIEDAKGDDNSASLAEENRGLKRLKNQFENKLNTETKLKRSLEERYQKAKLSETKARSEAIAAETELKTNLGQLKLLKDQNTKLVLTAAKTGGLKADKLSKELELVKANNIKLQEKLAANNKIGGSTSNDVPKTNAQKAQLDLEKSLKEVDLIKDQNQKLHQKIAELNSKYKDTPVVSADAHKVAIAQATKDVKGEGADIKELESIKSRNEELQNKVLNLVSKLKKAEEVKVATPEETSAKEKRLEQSVKKMNAELTKARTEVADKKKESIKSKTELTGLKNQIAKLKRDLEKASVGKTKKKAA